MKTFLKSATLLGAFMATVACGGGSTGGATGPNYQSQLLDLQRTLTDDSFTAEARMPSGSATYRGVANFNLADGSDADFTAAANGDFSNLPAYLGALRVNVNFGNDSLSGNVTNFTNYNQTPVNGRLDLSNGRLTDNNTGRIGDGLEAIASGQIAGRSLIMDVEGNVIGRNGEGIALYFDDRSSLAGGVGVAAR